MKLKITPRVHDRKSDATRLRREGSIPAIIYHKDKAGDAVSISEVEFTSNMRQVVPGRLPTTVFHLDTGHGTVRKVIIKDIQYHPVTYKVIHLDFEELHDDVLVKVKVPIVLQGEMDSAGIKLGGMIRVVIRTVRVECLPKDIPAFFIVDVKEMVVGDVLKLSQIDMPKTVRPLMKMNSVAISMVKK